MRTGCPMHIVTVLPHQKQLGKGHSKGLSRKARHRLEIIDWTTRSRSARAGQGSKTNQAEEPDILGKENPAHTPAVLRGARGSLPLDDRERHKTPQLFFPGGHQAVQKTVEKRSEGL